MLECFYLPVATLHAYCVSVSCNVSNSSRTGVGAGSGGHGARENRVKGGWKMHTVTEDNDRLKVG